MEKERVIDLSKLDTSKIAKAAEKALKIGDGTKYKCSESGILMWLAPILSKDKTAVIGYDDIPIANHTPIVKGIRIIDDGVRVIRQYLVDVFCKGKVLKEYTITDKDVKGNQPDAPFGGGHYIYPEARNGISRYKEALAIQIGDCEECFTEYHHNGYDVIDGERVYLNPGYSVTAKGMTDKYLVVMPDKLEGYGFINERHESRYDTLKSLIDIEPQNPAAIYVGVSHTFLTPLNDLLRESGYEPSYILCYAGRTGSGKTMLSKLLLSFFGADFARKESAPASFFDNHSVIEMSMGVTRCCMLLVDDKIPADNKRLAAKADDNEQLATRLIGNRKAIDRANWNGGLEFTKGYRPVCNLIITAEEAYKNVGESAIARAITCELKPGELNIKALTAAQEKAGELNECMSEYIQYVLIHWDELRDRLGKMFLEYRDKAQNGGHLRLAETVAHLQIGFSIMCEWLVSVGVMSTEESENERAKAWEIFMELSTEQNRRIYEEKPTALFLNAVREMMASGDIAFLPKPCKNGVDIPIEDAINGMRYEDIKNEIGYKDDEFYYIQPGKIYSAVRKFYADQGKNFPLSKETLWRRLYDDNLIEPTYDSNGKLKQCTKHVTFRDKRGKRPVLLWIRREVLEESEETET